MFNVFLADGLVNKGTLVYAKSTSKKTSAAEEALGYNPAKVSGDVMKITTKRKSSFDEMTDCYNSFTLRTLKEVLKNSDKNENVMISGASLMFALDMAAVGANGETYKQIARLFKKGATKRDLVSFANTYRKNLTKNGMVNIANSIWINNNNLRENNVEVNEEYLNFLRKYFKAASASLDFNDDAKKIINTWISDKTKGMIKDGVDKLNDETLMLIVNAMAFEGKWAKEYSESQINENGTFTNSKGEKETAKMLSSMESYYLSSDSAEGFLKYYEGGKYAFMAMLPFDKDISMSDFISGMDEGEFSEFLQSKSMYDVETLIPSFEFDYDINLNNTLKNMGMELPFKESADFLKMIDPATVNPNLVVYIGNVIQKTHIELDENGTKAAATTIIEITCGTTSVEPERRTKRVILDRPFVFAIMDMETGTPVFCGAVNSVA